MNFLGIHLHRYENIQQGFIETFMGEKITQYRNTNYRKCKECKKTQEYRYDSGGGYWSNLSEDQTEILNRKIHTSDGLKMKGIIDITTFKPPKGA